MLQGLYAAASGMEAQQTQFDAVSNDIANLSTPGYQASEVGFQSLLYSSAGSASGSNVATGAGASAAIVGRDQTQGPLTPTGRSLDVAIEGSGYLQMRRPDGTIGLTRDGVLELDSQGRITNQEGMPLQPAITLPPGVTSDQLKIASDGTVSAGAKKLGTISIVTVPAPGQLQANGDSMFTATTASGAIRPAGASTLAQGSLEGSNVSLASAMSEMITAQRTYQMSSQSIQYQDQMLQIANQIIKS
jgi:flagellar basal-body rod protein FlgG